jgi:serine/threonine-protein kinase
MIDLLAAIRAEQRAHWQAGNRIPIQVFLDRHPEVQRNEDSAIDLIYSEILLRQEMGETVVWDDYFRTFPQFAEQLRRQRAFHEMLGQGSSTSQPAVAQPSVNGTGHETTQTPTAEPRQFPAVVGYEIEGILGKGSHGIVYLARQLLLDKLVALKMLHSGDLSHLDLIRRDAKVLAQLDHPNIVRVIDFVESGGQSFYSMEYVKGRSLEDRLKSRPFPPREAAKLVETLARALHAVHQKNIVHRDLKPANVLLDQDGTPKVADFGLAKRLDGDRSLAASGQIVGNIAHMAPEQIDGDSDSAVDIWALGVLLYEALSGEQPFRGRTYLDTMEQIRRGVPRRRRTFGVDRDLETICLKCLEKDPSRRFASGEALADDLHRWSAGEPIQARPRPWPVRVWRTVRGQARRHATMTGVGAGVALAITAVVLFATLRLSSDELDAQQLQDARQQNVERLRAGQPVEYIGTTAGRDVSVWLTHDPTAKKVQAKDGSFAIQCWWHGLLELQPDPRQERYRFRAEVRHDEGTNDSYVGIFFLRQEHPDPNGLEQCYCLLAFNDVYCDAPTRKNPIRIATQLESESRPSPHPSDLSTPLFTPALNARGIMPWRRLMVQVEPGIVRFYWEDMLHPVKEISTDRLKKVARWAMLPEAGPWRIVPAFAPRGGLGLYVSRSSASFRNVVVEPLATSPY